MKFFQKAFRLLRKTAVNYGRDNGSMLAASLAYYAIFAIAPLIIIVITLVGFFLGDATVRGQIVAAVGRNISIDAARLIENLITDSSIGGGGIGTTLLGVGLLLFAASSLFSHLQRALNAIWNVPPPPKMGVVLFIKKRALGFVIILLIGLLLLVSFSISAILSIMDEILVQRIPVVGSLFPLLEIIITFVVMSVLFAMIFKILPDIHIRWRNALVGGVFTAVLFTIGKILISIFLSFRGQNATSQAAGSIVILLLWIYYSSQILLFGAEFTQTYTNRHPAPPPTLAPPLFQPGEAPVLPVAPPESPKRNLKPPPKVDNQSIISALIGMAAGMLLALLGSWLNRRS